eukprot:scaffold43734_cov37-Attheya_sp.AAC.1
MLRGSILSLTIRKTGTWRRSNGLPLTIVIVRQSRAKRGHVGSRHWRRRGHGESLALVDYCVLFWCRRIGSKNKPDPKKCALGQEL